MPYLQNTNYHGATVDNATAEQLKRQPAADLLRFEQHGDSTVIQAKLPEKGFAKITQNGEVHEKEYDIRINMNYFVRGMMRAVMDKNGDIDPEKVMELVNLCNDLNQECFFPEKESRYPELLEKLDIPPARREDFETFLHANGIPHTDPSVSAPLVMTAYGPIGHLYSEIEQRLVPYLAARDGKLGPKVQECAKESEAAYGNILQGYQDMANMDPENETRILYPMDCIAYTGLMSTFIEQTNSYKKHVATESGQPYNEADVTIQGEPVDLNFDISGENPRENRYAAFAEHHYMTVKVTLDGQPRTIALESTAPPTGQLLHRPEVERTGVGIYENAAEIEAFHNGNNAPKQFDAQFYQEYANAKEYRAEKMPLIKASEKSFHRYIQLHTGAKVNQLSDKKLAEYAAKVVVAQTMMQQEPRPAFDLEKVRRRAATLADSYQIRAYMKQVGRENLCETLSRRPTPNLVEQLVGPRNRYALKDETRRALQELGRGMKTEGRSKEWKALQQALLSDAGNSVALFDKAEAYLKGKKSVRMTQEGRDSFDLAMKAIALAARDGDAMAEQRANMLMDRVNEVRGATPGSKDYVSMEKYLGGEAAQAEAPAAERQAGQAQRPAHV